MDYWSTNNNKKQYRKNLSIEYKKPIFQSENNDNEQKSKNSNINNETLNLFKGIVKVTKKSLKEKKTPETQSNTVNNNNNIFDFANSVYNNEEHLYDDKFFTIKSPKNNNPTKSDNVISLSPTLKSKNRIFNKYKSSLELFDLSKNISKEKNLKKSLFNKNTKQISFYCNNYPVKGKSRRRSVMGDMTHKNRNSRNFNFFFKLKEKDKIPSKTPYLDKIWNFSNKSDFKPKTNIKSKENTNISLVKRNSQENKVIKISDTNIKFERDKKNELIPNQKDKLEKDNTKKFIEKKQEEKIEEDENKKDKIIIYENKEKKTNIIFHILNKPFICCLK